jgi:hypothetical protein
MVMAREPQGGSFRPVPAGVWVARCFRIVDLGTQTVEWQGDVKLQRKVQLTWELFGEDEAGVPLVELDSGKPLTISKRYTLSLSDKAKLRADLQAWRGKPFTKEELAGFELDALAGKYCMLNVTQDLGANGRTYSNVSSITPLPAAMRKNPPPGVHPTLIFDIDNPDMIAFNGFYEALRATIEASEEWKARHAPKAAPAQTASPAKAGARQAPVAAGSAFDDMDDDVPF